MKWLPYTLLLIVLGLTAACLAPRTTKLDALLENYRPAELAGMNFPEAASKADFRLVVFGHAYAKMGRALAGDLQPAPNLVANATMLANIKPDLVVSLGDFIEAWHPAVLAPAQEFLHSLGAPAINAPGNHDLTNSKGAYQEQLGKLWGGLRMGRYLLLVVDTEQKPWSLDDTQVHFIKQALNAAQESDVDRVLVFGHKLIFSANRSRYQVVFDHVNARDGWTGSSNFNGAVRPLLEEFISDGGQVTWFGGDVGVAWSYGLLFDRDPDSGITFVATGIGDQVWDNALQVDLDSNGQVQIEVLPLSPDSKLNVAIETYGLEHWKGQFE